MSIELFDYRTNRTNQDIFSVKFDYCSTRFGNRTTIVRLSSIEFDVSINKIGSIRFGWHRLVIKITDQSKKIENHGKVFEKIQNSYLELLGFLSLVVVALLEHFSVCWLDGFFSLTCFFFATLSAFVLLLTESWFSLGLLIGGAEHSKSSSIKRRILRTLKKILPFYIFAWQSML